MPRTPLRECYSPRADHVCDARYWYRCFPGITPSPEGGFRIRRKLAGKLITNRRAATRDAAVRIWREAYADNRRAIIEPRRTRFGPYLETLIRDRDDGTGASTVRRDRYIYDQYIAGTRLADRYLVDVTRDDVKRFLAGCRPATVDRDGNPLRNPVDRLSVSSVRTIRSVVTRTLDQAVEDEVLQANPARPPVPLPHGLKPETTGRAPEDGAVLRTLDHMQRTGDEYAVAVLFAATTGVRLSELRGVRWPDLIGFESGRDVTFAIRGQYVRANRYTDKTKTIGSQREVPVIPALVLALRGWRMRQDELRAAAGRKWRGGDRESGFVFTGRSGAPVSEWTLRTHLKDAYAAANGGKAIRWHDLRHGYATDLVAGGVPEAIAQRLTGHVNPKTFRRYTHLTDQGRAIGAAAIEAAYGRTIPSGKGSHHATDTTRRSDAPIGVTAGA